MKRGYSVNAEGDVVLTMSREDFERLLMAMGATTRVMASFCPDEATFPYDWILGLLNRMNEGNPHYKPYKLSGG
jgi:hypothetical protein